MAKPPKRRSKSGPQRGPGRRKGRSIGIFCANAKCRNKTTDCKNKPFALSRAEVDESCCRSLRPQARLVKFCSQQHLELCRKKVVNKRGGREALSTEQVSLFFATVVHECHAPWAGALLLVQLCLGDRADAARQASTNWFKNIDPHGKGLPEANIPQVNGKTHPRCVPLPLSFARLLWSWITQKPLQSERAQWPLDAQDLHGAVLRNEDRYLFCARTGSGKNKPVIDKPISERSFLKQIRKTCDILCKQRVEHHRAEKTHTFDDVDLSKVGTHSWKKTAVTLMKDDHVSTSIISTVTGTSARTLDDVYDVPTQKRQRQVVDAILSPVMARVTEPAGETSGSAEPSRHTAKESQNPCYVCSKLVDINWQYCAFCGSRLHHSA